MPLCLAARNPRMTLARIFLLGIFLTASTPYLLGVSMPQDPPASPAGNPPDSQNPSATSQPQKPSDQQKPTKEAASRAQTKAQKTRRKRSGKPDQPPVPPQHRRLALLPEQAPQILRVHPTRTPPRPRRGHQRNRNLVHQKSWCVREELRSPRFNYRGALPELKSLRLRPLPDRCSTPRKRT